MSAIYNTFFKSKRPPKVLLEITPGAFAHLYEVSNGLMCATAF